MLSYGARWLLSLMSRGLRNPLACSIPASHRNLGINGENLRRAPKRTVQRIAGQHVRGQVTSHLMVAGQLLPI